MKGYEISTEKSKLDFDVIYSFISTSYWAKNMPKALLKKAISNSLCFGLYKTSGEQVAFARLITDTATFAYLADVFVIETERGKGLSKWLVSTIVQHPELQGLRRMMLATKDAHGLYAQFGFKAVENPEILMQIWHPSIYQNNA